MRKGGRGGREEGEGARKGVGMNGREGVVGEGGGEGGKEGGRGREGGWEECREEGRWREREREGGRGRKGGREEEKGGRELGTEGGR